MQYSFASGIKQKIKIESKTFENDDYEYYLDFSLTP